MFGNYKEPKSIIDPLEGYYELDTDFKEGLVKAIHAYLTREQEHWLELDVGDVQLALLEVWKYFPLCLSDVKNELRKLPSTVEPDDSPNWL